MAFPSGTATAQLISVLHKEPTVAANLRKRTGYRPIESDERRVEGADEEEPLTPSADDDKEIQHNGLSALVWSLIPSAALTVREPYTAYRTRANTAFSCFRISSESVVKFISALGSYNSPELSCCFIPSRILPT